MRGLGFHSRCSNCNPSDLHQFGHVIRPNRSHGQAVLLGGQEDLHIPSDGLLHLSGLAGDLRPEARENLSCGRLKQRQVICRRLPDLVRELGIEGVKVLDGDDDMVAVVH
uniref:Uncharacterized protein n=1 Tax=Arundo donax TaxID=35708 RepID=A0A0A9G0B9_ARUDO